MTGYGDRGAGRGCAAARPWRVAVVGGGISGLAAAHALDQAAKGRVAVTVLEATAQLGGKLRVEEVGGLSLDVGAEAVLARRPEAVQLAGQVGLAADVVVPSTSAARVWSRGRLRPLPAGLVMGVPTDLRALATSGVLRAGELARVPADGWLPRTRVEPDVSVGSYLTRRVGRAVVDRLVEPLLGGVYAGHADLLSLAGTIPALFARVMIERSVLAAARRIRADAATAAEADPAVFAGIRGGVGRLPGAVAAATHATVRTDAAVRELRRTPSGWRLVVGPSRADSIGADAVVLAVPAGAAARLLSDMSPRAAADLEHVDYASVVLLTLLFPQAALEALPGGSGFLVPPVERRLVKAVTVSSAKWGWVAEAGTPAGVAVVRASVGRHREQTDLQHDDADLADLVLTDLAELAGIQTPPIAMRITRWGGALPQYAVGHLARVARVRGALAGHRTLALAGAAYDGVGVPACIASGRAAAAHVLGALEASWAAGKMAP